MKLCRVAIEAPDFVHIPWMLVRSERFFLGIKRILYKAAAIPVNLQYGPRNTYDAASSQSDLERAVIKENGKAVVCRSFSSLSAHLAIKMLRAAKQMKSLVYKMRA
jgi:hypothetical protein